MDTPFLRPYDASFTETVTDGAVNILGSAGVDRFSVRALARWMRVHPSTLLGEYTRARLLEIIVITFADRWLRWSEASAGAESAGLRLPATPDERLGVRVRLGLEQLAESERLRDEVGPSFQLDWLRDRERELLTHRMRSMAPTCCPPVDDEVVSVLALIDGLRQVLSLEQASGTDGVTTSRAIAIAASHLRTVTAHRVDCPSSAAAG